MYLNQGTTDPVNKVLWKDQYSIKSQGGFQLVTSELKSTDWLMKGAILGADYATGLANIVKTAKIIAGGTTTAPRVEKNHEFKAGDYAFITAGSLAVTISSIDTTNADYDVFTFSAALTGATAGVIFKESVAAGASAGAFKYAPIGLLNDNTKIVGQPSVTAVISAYEIQEANLPYFVSADIKTALKASAPFMFI